MSDDLRLAFGESIDICHCSSCGGEISAGHGYVESGIDALAAYWFDRHAHGADRRVRLLVAFDSGADPANWAWGEALAVEVRNEPDQFVCALVDAQNAPVSPDPGDVVHDREDGLHSSLLTMLWNVIDTVVSGDPAVAAFLANDGV